MKKMMMKFCYLLKLNTGKLKVVKPIHENCLKTYLKARTV